VRARTHLASLLLATLLAIFGRPDWVSLVNCPYAAPVPNAVLMSIRNSVSTIDQFLAGGNIDALWKSLDVQGHGLDPWPIAGESDRDLTALAFRSSFHGAHLTVGSVESEGGLYEVALQANDASGPVPIWIDHHSGQSAHATSVLLDASSGKLERVSAAPSTNPLHLKMASQETGIAAASPVSLTVSRLTLQPVSHGPAQLTITGPALISPIDGFLDVTGRGRLQVLRPDSYRWQIPGSNERFQINPADLLYFTSGSVTLSLPEDAPVSFLYGMLDSAELRRAMTDEDGRPIATYPISDYLNAPTPTWFGSIDSLIRTPVSAPAGRVALDVEWIVMPPDSSETLDSHQTTAVAIDLDDPDFAFSPGPGDPHDVHATNHTRILLVVGVSTSPM
jgi:hypothetical protein